MFSFNSRKVQQELQQFLLALANQNGAARARVYDNRRIETRTQLNVGVWVAPLRDGSPDLDAAFTAITKDLNSAGMAVMTDQPIPTEEVLVRVPSEPKPRWVRATVLHSKDLGSGWRSFSMKAAELLDEAQFPDLQQLQIA